MKKRIVCILSVVCLLLCAVPFTAQAAADDIVILYENDVHCAIEGYSTLAAYRTALQDDYAHVGVVSCGDYLQGSSLGAISQGEYIVNIVNMVGYDAMALGNHEFDYRLDRLQELTDILNVKPVCANFKRLADNTPLFDPYRIVSYGEVDIAYIGVTTPDTLTSSSPSQFLDENGDYLYTFSSTDLYDTVQESIDNALAAGADYVVALSHLGTEFVNEAWSAQALVQNTVGLDVVLDGHSHSIEEGITVADEDGNDVLISSTGTQFSHIGKLTVAADGTLSTTLIDTDGLTQTDAAIDAYITQINEEYAQLGDRKIGESTVDLLESDENGNRLVRLQETNLGDFCADAFRAVTGADIGVINGGGIRAGMTAGDVTFNDILSIFPFNNTVCMSQVTGQQVLDLLEMGLRYYPDENGSFQHVSGLTFTIDDSIPSSVVVDENDVFLRVDGAYRVQDVCVWNDDSGTYEPLVTDAVYTLASHNYLLMDHGGGAAMLDGSTVLLNSGMLDVEMLEVYITDHLGGVIDETYAASQNRIRVGKPTETTTTATTTTTVTTTTTAASSGGSPATGDTACAVLFPVLLCAGAAVLMTVRKRRAE